jgi:DnaK suppressor protein
MTTQKTRAALATKMHELISRRISLEDIAVEKSADELDEIRGATDRAMAIDSLTRKLETRALVSEAMLRIESNTYGICAECDGEIGEKRLAAIPWAKYCIQCQERRDDVSAQLRWDTIAALR